MVLFWGCDPETTPWGFTGQFASRMCYFWKEAGIKLDPHIVDVFINMMTKE
jgi:hypothetical protein